LLVPVVVATGYKTFPTHRAVCWRVRAMGMFIQVI
jgi:hypothetical protein